MKSLLAIIAAAALVGCSGSSYPNYIITYEAQLKSGGTVRGCTIKRMSVLNEASLGRVLMEVYQNPGISSNGIVILAVVKMDE